MLLVSRMAICRPGLGAVAGEAPTAKVPLKFAWLTSRLVLGLHPAGGVGEVVLSTVRLMFSTVIGTLMLFLTVYVMQRVTPG
ncbi:MAG: hypothetical protein E6J45_07865 [Chloroflexi bacterium]|nr:MAG: hypothetical protein E6J45_07865 [Chloroflexota bacterium]